LRHAAGERTALINQLRAVLLERGIVVPPGRRKLERHVDALLAVEETRLSPRTGLLVDDLRAEWRELDRRILAFDDELAGQARPDETARRLTSIPGIGPLNATALTYEDQGVRISILARTRPETGYVGAD
jgi:transposase